MERLLVEPLTKAAFAPYGEVLERDGAELRVINEGTTDRLHALGTVDVSSGGGRPIISIFAGRRRAFPLSITMLERHPLGSQCFFPLQSFDWLVVVGAFPRGSAQPALRCFHAQGDQGVSYSVGVWHHPLLILQPRQDFMVVDRDGPGVNCEEVAFSPSLIALEAI